MKHAAKKAAHLTQHGYPKGLLLESFLKANDKNRELLLRTTTSKPEAREVEYTYLTTTYNKSFNRLKTQVESTWDLLQRSSTTRFLQDRPIKVGYRRPKNLSDILVRAKLPEILMARPPVNQQPENIVKTTNVDIVLVSTRQAKYLHTRLAEHIQP